MSLHSGATFPHPVSTAKAVREAAGALVGTSRIVRWDTQRAGNAGWRRGAEGTVGTCAVAKVEGEGCIR